MIRLGAAQAKDFPGEIGVVLEQHPFEGIARTRGGDNAGEQRVIKVGVLRAEEGWLAEKVEHTGAGRGRGAPDGRHSGCGNFRRGEGSLIHGGLPAAAPAAAVMTKYAPTTGVRGRVGARRQPQSSTAYSRILVLSILFRFIAFQKQLLTH